MTDLRSLIHNFARQRVLVLGDMVADQYIIGKPSRISREAPVLVLEETESVVRPGGATNTAANLRSLGGSTAVAGVIGDDEMGRTLVRTLQHAGIDTEGLIVDGSRPTSTKTRIVGKGVQEIQQQIVRIDRVDHNILRPADRDRLIRFVCDTLDRIDALIISDYENGVISPEVVKACLPETRRRGLVTIVDSHGDLFRFAGVTAATPNQPEAEETLGRPIRTTQDLEQAGEEIRRRMDARGVLITRGSEGMALFEEGRPMLSLPIALAHELDARDPTGAGDTVSAVFTLALTSSATMREAAFLANLAGGEVVKKMGTATVDPDTLIAAAARTGSAEQA